MATVLPFRPRAKKEPVSILIGEDDRGLYADVDGFEVRAPRVEQLLLHVLRRVKDVWEEKS